MKVPKATLRGKTWRVQVQVDGERYSITAPTAKEAEAKAAAFKSGLIAAQRRPQKMTLEQACDEYIDTALLAASSKSTYRSVKRTTFRQLMQKDIHSITESDIRKAIQTERKRFGDSKISVALALITSALEDQRVFLNKRKLRFEERPKEEKHYLQLDEVPKLVEVIQGSRFEIPILMALFMGLRKNEVLGLHWDCVDFKRKVIHIRCGMTQCEKGDGINGSTTTLREGAKSSAGVRTVECPDIILDKLRKLPRNLDGLVFHISISSPPYAMHRFCKQAGITDTTFHGLRHTNAAIMHALGVSDLDAIRRNGWSSVDIYHKLYAYAFDSDISSGTAAMLAFANAGGKIAP